MQKEHNFDRIHKKAALAAVLKFRISCFSFTDMVQNDGYNNAHPTKPNIARIGLAISAWS